jgi:hypothetical protein
MSREPLRLEEGQIYLIEGIKMTYLNSEGSKHYFIKVDQDGKTKGRKRMLMGTEEMVAKVLQARLSNSHR